MITLRLFLKEHKILKGIYCENLRKYNYKDSSKLRCITQLVEFKKSLSKLVPYLITEYVTKASTIAIHPDIKVILSSKFRNLTIIIKLF